MSVIKMNRENERTLKNRDILINFGIYISVLRKMQGMSQEALAEKAGISRSLLSAVEAPGLVKTFTVDVLLKLADALGILPEELLEAAGRDYPFK